MLSPPELKVLRDAVYAEAEADLRTGRADDPYFADAMLGDPSQRVWNLPSRGQLYCDLAVHPVVMDLVKSFVEGGIRLSTFSANITLPGSGMMHLHADQGTNPQPWGEKPHGLNFIWCLDDFLDETGATRIVPGSHRLNRSAASMEEIMSETVAVEAPAGSLIVMESRVWHKTGANSHQGQEACGDPRLLLHGLLHAERELVVVSVAARSPVQSDYAAADDGIWQRVPTGPGQWPSRRLMGELECPTC